MCSSASTKALAYPVQLFEELSACVFSKSELLIGLFTSSCHIRGILIHRLRKKERGVRMGERERITKGYTQKLMSALCMPTS